MGETLARDHRGVEGHPARAHDLRDVRAGLVDADRRGRPGAPFFNDTTKYVVSSTLTDPTWRNSQVVGPYDPEAIRRLKDEVDGDLYVSGSVTLVRAMLDDGLVDELHLFVYPLTLGDGPAAARRGRPAAQAVAGRRASATTTASSTWPTGRPSRRSSLAGSANCGWGREAVVEMRGGKTVTVDRKGAHRSGVRDNVGSSAARAARPTFTRDIRGQRRFGGAERSPSDVIRASATGPRPGASLPSGVDVRAAGQRAQDPSRARRAGRRSAAGDVVPDRADLVDRPALRIGQVPVDVALARDVRARVAAAHRHDDVGLLASSSVSRARDAVGEVDAELAPSTSTTSGWTRSPGVVPAEAASCAAAGGALEERLAHLRAAGVVQADEQRRWRSSQRRRLGAGRGCAESAASASGAAGQLRDDEAPATDAGAIPAKVSENMRPMVIAGLAKLRRAGEQVGGADVGADRGRRASRARPVRAQGEDHEHQPERRDDLGEQVRAGSRGGASDDADRGQREHTLASTAPRDAAGDLGRHVGAARRAGARPPKAASTSDTTGLKCAPETGPNIKMIANSPAAVAAAFSSSCRPASSGDSRWAAMPEPTTSAARNALPRNSASSRRPSGRPVMRRGLARARWPSRACSWTRWVSRDLDVGEPGGGQPCANSVARQRAGDAAGVGRHVGAGGLVHVRVGDDVRDREAAARAQDPRRLGEHRALSAARLMTQLEMTTSTEASGERDRPRCSP